MPQEISLPCTKCKQGVGVTFVMINIKSKFYKKHVCFDAVS